MRTRVGFAAALSLVQPFTRVLANLSRPRICRQWPPDPLQLELTDRLDLQGVFDFRQHSRANQDLSGSGLVAQARGNVGYRADGGVVEVFLESNNGRA
jgi:hypothetical protein